MRLTHGKHDILTGYASLDKKRERVAVSHDGRPVSVRASDATEIPSEDWVNESREALVEAGLLLDARHFLFSPPVLRTHSIGSE